MALLVVLVLVDSKFVILYVGMSSRVFEIIINKIMIIRRPVVFAVLRTLRR